VNGPAVVDASVALKWYVAETDSGAALGFLQQHQSDLTAPTLLLTEFANALWKKWRKN
jgi:predicted nucleic acid-binding protein